MIRRFTVMLLLFGLAMVFLSLALGYVPDTELNQTARYYADNTVTDTGAANIVTAIIVTYRGLDTLGEVTVLFLTAAIVGLVLARIAVWILRLIKRWAARTRTRLDDLFLAQVERPVAVTLALAGLGAATLLLDMHEMAEFATIAVLRSILVLVVSGENWLLKDLHS